MKPRVFPVKRFNGREWVVVSTIGRGRKWPRLLRWLEGLFRRKRE